MTIPLHELSQKFTDILCTDDLYAGLLRLDDVLQAGTQLQRLAQRLAPLVEGGIEISEQGLQHLATRYVDHSLSPRTESLAAWSVKQLLEHSPGLDAEGLQHLAQDLETITAAVRETARLHEANPLPGGAAAGDAGRSSWVNRKEQVPTSPRCLG